MQQVVQPDLYYQRTTKLLLVDSLEVFLDSIKNATGESFDDQA